MKKTSLYLDEDVDRALARRAAEEGLTKAEFIRRGLARLVDRPQRPRPTAVGFADDGPTDLAANVDRYLREGGFGER
jgi:Ribbon-helix-helix protein, copG family